MYQLCTPDYDRHCIYCSESKITNTTIHCTSIFTTSSHLVHFAVKILYKFHKSVTMDNNEDIVHVIMTLFRLKYIRLEETLKQAWTVSPD